MSEPLDLFSWEHASQFIKNLDNEWNDEIKATEDRRKIRYHLLSESVEQMRLNGKLQPHETYIPVRIADTNINREKANWIAYIIQSPRTGVFVPKDGGTIPGIERLETEFTRWSRYEGWEDTFFRWSDGCLTHGTDFVETLFDTSKPGHFAHIQLGHERVKYPKDTENLQKAPAIVVDCVYSAEELRAFSEDPEMDWSPEHVDEVLKDQEGKEDREGSFCIRKLYFWHNGVVQLGYWHDKATGWLKAPDKLFLGKRNDDGTQVEETEYPIEPLPYTVSENGRLIDTKGRVFLDMHVQDAATAGASAYINGLTLSSRLQGCPANPNDNSEIKQSDSKFANGAIWNQKMEFIRTDPPPAECIKGVEWLINQNANETSQVNYAAMNRQDSRKTATEIQNSTQQASLLNSERVAVLGLAMRNVHRRGWEIARSQVMQGTLTSACRELYGFNYIILPAGDVDVVKRQERQQQMMQDWPVLQQTPAAQVFLEDFLRLRYAEQADKYIQALKAGDVKGQMLAAIPQMLRGMAAKDPMLGAALAPHMPELEQVEAQIEQVLNPEAQPGAKDSAPASGGEQPAY